MKLRSYISLKKTFIISLVLLFLSSCFSKRSNYDFSGNWSWEGVESYFSLELKQTGNKVEGFHNGGKNDGSRIDSSEGMDSPSLIGIVSGDTIKGTIRSGYNDVVNPFVIKMIDNNRITFNLDKKTNDEIYIPLSVLMERKISK